MTTEETEETARDSEETSSAKSISDKLKLLLLPTENSSGNAFQPERCLVAWVLLTRLSQAELDRAWGEHQPLLESFGRELLQKEERPCFDLYIRMMAQVTARLTSYPVELGQSLFHAWKKIPATKLVEVHIDVLCSFNHFIQSDPVAADVAGLLESVWKVHLVRLEYDAVSKDEESPVSEFTSNEAKDPSLNLDITIDNEEGEWKLMCQTLEALLNNNQQDFYSPTTWQEILLKTFQSHGNDLTPDSLAPSILEWITAQQIKRWPVTLITGWHEWFFNLVQSRITRNPSFRKTLLRSPKAASDFNNLMLAHVVSPSDRSLRAMAWQTLVLVVETSGWNWILQASSKSSRLGSGTALCTWIRMAGGEYRIQLHTSNNSATSLAVGEACARVLISAVQYCAKLAEEPHRMRLPGDALLHLRQSLEQALGTTVEYLQTDGVNGAFSEIAVRLFGILLMEIDIWELMVREDEKHRSPQAILQCLEAILPRVMDYSLLPGLVNILSEAEDDIVKHGQLGCLLESLVDFLRGFWQRKLPLADQLDDSIAWACSCTELWSNLAQNTGDDGNWKRQLALALVEWIESVLLESEVRQSALPRVQSYLSLAIGCYMTLSNDRAKQPREQESSVILRALQLCERS